MFVGKTISRVEKCTRPWFPATKAGERFGGLVLVLVVLTIVGNLTWWILFGLSAIHPWLGIAAKVLLTYQILATKCLKLEAKKVETALNSGDLEKSRLAVSYLVGRDTQALSAVGVTKATVETVAENTVDGVIAPLFFMALGGPVGGILYKAVNTMDSMVGYKNDKYLYYGTVAARLDDVLNYIPARFGGLCMIVAAYILPFDGKGAWRIWRRDRRNHKSPNSAQTESCCAGALQIQLAGDATYFGKLYKKPFIGDDIRPIVPDDITKSCQLLYGAASVALPFLILLRGVIPC